MMLTIDAFKKRIEDFKISFPEEYHFATTMKIASEYQIYNPVELDSGKANQSELNRLKEKTLSLLKDQNFDDAWKTLNEVSGSFTKKADPKNVVAKIEATLKQIKTSGVSRERQMQRIDEKISKYEKVDLNLSSKDLNIRATKLEDRFIDGFYEIEIMRPLVDIAKVWREIAVIKKK